MSASNIDSINTTLTELRELMALVEKNYPDVPSILCKISIEKGEKLCDLLRNLTSEGVSGIAMPETIVAEDVRETVPTQECELEIPIAELIETAEPEAVAGSEDAEVFAETEEVVGAEVDEMDVEEADVCLDSEAETETEVEPETDDVTVTTDGEEPFVLAWDTSDEDFCLFDRVPTAGSQEPAEEEPIVAIVEAEVETEAEDAISEPTDMEAETEVGEPECPCEEDADESEEEAIDNFSDEETQPEEEPLDAQEAIAPEQSTEEVEEEDLLADEDEGRIKTFEGKELQKMMSINDRFLFRRELFDGDGEEMNATIEDLNHITSYEASLAYLHTRFEWDFESETVELLCMLLRQRFE